ncbi:MAG: hypothetical protein ACI89J_002083 [Hyphomicrobiaceae bacterium]|jgi:hypothetical protein
MPESAPIVVKRNDGGFYRHYMFALAQSKLMPLLVDVNNTTIVCILVSRAD